MATQLLAVGSTSASSSDLVVASGTPVTVVLNNTAAAVDGDAQVKIEIKDPVGAYFEMARLTSSQPATSITAAGTYRFTRITGGACGVFSA